MSVAIKAEDICKAYQLGEFSTGTISRDIERWWALLRGKQDPFLKIGETNDRTKKGTSDIVWSLKDINFEINQGDAIGIIGRNGAGKSTLLKVLSRVTSPSKGIIKVKGRIASLLEVGTGFHPELTGRENIFLNGAILGMKKSEIQRKFDEIVYFSEVERYIDTPVKRYSSGMYVRLAFAVAAHLECEILIVDEVLAVGDAEFQKKCLGKMNDVSKEEGRTVLFVSHNMGAVSQLCKSVIVLQNGGIIYQGNSNDGIVLYNKMGIRDNIIYESDLQMAKKNYIKKAILTQFGHITNSIENGSPIEFELDIDCHIELIVSFEIIIRDKDHKEIIFSPLGLAFMKEHNLSKGLTRIKLSFDIPYLATGRYYVDLIMANAGVFVYDNVQSALYFDILNNFNNKTGWVFTQAMGQGAILINGDSHII